MQRYRVKPDKKIDLEKIDPNDTSALDIDKNAGKERLSTLNKRLAELQELLYAESKHRLLVILQAMDTGGKDGTIRHVFRGVNPQGVSVATFGPPTAVELAHDYLWRAHPCVPGNGRIAIFNRSYYEDVLVVRVKSLAPPEVWQRRFDQINDFERMLAEEGTTIRKFFLHIDRDEQKRRLEKRLNSSEKRWKFRLGDLEDRRLWPEFIKAYEDILRKTSTTHAPWYVIPANDKLYRNLAVSTILIETLLNLRMKYPEPLEDLDGIAID